MCYKLIIDISDCNSFNDFYNKLTDIGDVIYNNGVFYIFTEEKGINKNTILFLLKTFGIEQFLLKDIKFEDVKLEKTDMNFVSIWINEHFSKCQEKKIETERQKELKQMIDNIEKVRKTIKKNN